MEGTEQWDRGRDTSDVDCTTHIQLLLTVFLLFCYYIIIIFGFLSFEENQLHK